jgi:hypothetical protein
VVWYVACIVLYRSINSCTRAGLGDLQFAPRQNKWIESSGWIGKGSYNRSREGNYWERLWCALRRVQGGRGSWILELEASRVGVKEEWPDSVMIIALRVIHESAQGILD